MTDLLDSLRDKAYHLLTSNPEYLLARPGAPGPGSSTVISARLIGLDEQHEGDMLLPGYVQTLYMPIYPGFTADLGRGTASLSQAEYEPINWFADFTLSNVLAVGTSLERFMDPAAHEARIRFLLYRRVTRR